MIKKKNCTLYHLQFNAYEGGCDTNLGIWINWKDTKMNDNPLKSTAEKTIIRQPKCEFLLCQIPILWGDPSWNGCHSLAALIILISYILLIVPNSVSQLL